MAIMYDREVWARYTHPEGHVGRWVMFKPRQVRLTQARFSSDGNEPYVSGTDWTAEIALLFKNVDGTWSGIDLTDVSEIVISVVSTRNAAVDDRKLSDGEITKSDQTTDHKDGGTRGHFTFTYADTDEPAAGEHYFDCKVTYSDEDVSEEFSGRFEVLS